MKALRKFKKKKLRFNDVYRAVTVQFVVSMTTWITAVSSTGLLASAMMQTYRVTKQD
jgi:hypothetical protein